MKEWVYYHLESTQISLLNDELPAVHKKTSSSYSSRFVLITVILGIACLITAIVLTIVGVVGLRNYGFNNGPFIAGIVLFGVGGAFAITGCRAACYK